MIRTSWFRGLLTLCMTGGLVASVSTEAEAQAWVAEKGELAASANYTTGISDDLVDPDGNTYGNEDLSIDNHMFTLGASYVPMERLGLSVSLPLLLVAYTGDQDAVFSPHGPYDDGDYHFTPTDLRFGARYQVFEGSKTIAPHFAVSVPTADYVTRGYAGAGRGIFKGHVGLSAGAVLDPWLDKAFVHLTTEFSFGTKPKVTDPAFDEDAFDEYSQNYIDVEFTAGYFVTEAITISAIAAYHQQLDGITFNEVNPNMKDEVNFEWHDIALKETYLHPGIDVAYQVNDALSATAYFRTFVSGSNTRNLLGGGIGINYTFLKADVPTIDDSWDDEGEWDEDESFDDVEAVVDEADAEADAGAVE